MGGSNKIDRGFLLITIILTLSVALSFQKSCGSSTSCSCSCTCNCCPENHSNCCSDNCCTHNQNNCKPHSTDYSPDPTNTYPIQPREPSNPIIVNNNSTLEQTLTINSTVNLLNTIHIPINVATTNDVNVIIKLEESPTESSPSPQIERIAVPVPVPAKNEPTSTVPEPMPVLIPMPNRPKVVPFPLAVPYPLPQLESNCCYTLTTDLKQPMKQNCGPPCKAQYMYYPQNPCIGGCTRLNYCLYRNCGVLGCRMAYQNCNMCDSDFYRTYDGFARCSGCFVW